MPEPSDSRALLQALSAWARASPHGCRIGGLQGDYYDTIQLHHRPDPLGPEIAVTLRATLLDGRPVIQAVLPAHAAGPPSTTTADISLTDTSLAGTELPARDPTARCDGCGAMGTVGRATRTDGQDVVLEQHCFCLACWPEQSARYRARWEEEHRLVQDAAMRGERPHGTGVGHGMTFETATWHTALDLVRQIERSMVATVPPTRPDLAAFAAEIQRQAPELVGEMPWEIEMFLQRYGARPS